MSLGVNSECTGSWHVSCCLRWQRLMLGRLWLRLLLSVTLCCNVLCSAAPPKQQGKSVQDSLECAELRMQPCQEQCCHPQLKCTADGCVPPACGATDPQSGAPAASSGSEAESASSAAAAPGCSLWAADSSRVLVFYHVAAIRHWPEVVRTQADRITFSGLYEAADAIYCFVLGLRSNATVAAAMELSEYGDKFIVLEASLNVTHKERFTLEKLRFHVRPKDRVLYLHSKGVTRDEHDDNIFYWNWYMMYCLVKHYRSALAGLETHDTVGVQYRHTPFSHYSGNFWWATGAYLLQLEVPIAEGHVQPEAWLHTKQPNWLGLEYQRTLKPIRTWVLYGFKVPPRTFVDQHGTWPNCRDRTGPIPCSIVESKQRSLRS